MPYIAKEYRPFLVAFINELKRYPSWRNHEENSCIIAMLHEWLKVQSKDDELKKDGMINFICTTLIKNTHQCYTKTGNKKILVGFNKEIARTIRLILTMEFEISIGKRYPNYERLWGLLGLMEEEFNRRGWCSGRPDIRKFFSDEKKHWRSIIIDYEDSKIKENGDID